MEINHFNIACCDLTLGNHSFNGYPFADAQSVESYLGLTAGSVSFYATNKFSTIVPYDINYTGNGSLLDNSTYKDFWGIIRDIKFAAAPNPRTNVNFYSNSVRTIEGNAFRDFDNSTISIKSVESLGQVNGSAVFPTTDNSEINIGFAKNMSTACFAVMTNSIIRLDSKIKTMNFLGTATNALFDGSNNLTLYCSKEFSLIPMVVASIANPSVTNFNLITY
jgi:hypothetical protein